jgi:hypothetical protein
VCERKKEERDTAGRVGIYYVYGDVYETTTTTTVVVVSLVCSVSSPLCCVFV